MVLPCLAPFRSLSTGPSASSEVREPSRGTSTLVIMRQVLQDRGQPVPAAAPGAVPEFFEPGWTPPRRTMESLLGSAEVRRLLGLLQADAAVQENAMKLPFELMQKDVTLTP